MRAGLRDAEQFAATPPVCGCLTPVLDSSIRYSGASHSIEGLMSWKEKPKLGLSRPSVQPCLYDVATGSTQIMLDYATLKLESPDTRICHPKA